jgi:hypothetical protein
MNKIDLSKIDYRGGNRNRKPMTKSTSRFLHCLFKLRGGEMELARKIGCHSQELTRWKRLGAVPLRRVGEISRKMEIVPEMLNYEGMLDILSVVTGWKYVVASALKDNPKMIVWVMKGKLPKEKI